MHVINFNKFINKEIQKYNNSIDAEGIIVIGNDEVKIVQESPSKNLKRVDELYNYIKEFPSDKFTMSQVNEIAKCVTDNNALEVSKYPIDCVGEELIENLKFIKKDIISLKGIEKIYIENKNKTIHYRDFSYMKEDVRLYMKENESIYPYVIPDYDFISLDYNKGDIFSGSAWIYSLDVIKEDAIKKYS